MRQSVFLLGLAEVLENHHGIALDLFDCRVVVLEDVNPALVVGRSRALIALAVAESLGKVEAETVHFVFRQKILQAFLHVRADDFVLVIPVVEHVVGMGCLHIEEGVVGSGTVS